MPFRSMLLSLFLAMVVCPGFAQVSPFGDGAVTPGSQVVASSPVFHQPIPAEPVLPADPLASATQVAKDAFAKLDSSLAYLREMLARKDYKKASELVTMIEAANRDRKKGKGVVRGLIGQLRDGAADESLISELQGRFAAYKAQAYSEMTAALLKAADNHKKQSTAKGPGGGNVACAYLVSMILRASSLVPTDWNENVAETLTKRLGSELGWSKLPATGKASSGAIKASAMKPGDVVFWSPNEHVGIYLGNGMALSNSSSAARAAIHPVAGYYDGWVPRYVMRPPGGPKS